MVLVKMVLLEEVHNGWNLANLLIKYCRIDKPPFLVDEATNYFERNVVVYHSHSIFVLLGLRDGELLVHSASGESFHGNNFLIYQFHVYR